MLTKAALHSTDNRGIQCIYRDLLPLATPTPPYLRRCIFFASELLWEARNQGKGLATHGWICDEHPLLF